MFHKKTLTVAKKFEVPIKQNVFVTFFSAIETKSRFLMIPFAVADFQGSTFGKQFFDKYRQRFNLHDSSMNFKYSFNDQLTIASFISLVEKNSFFFPLVYQKSSEKAKL